MSRRTVRLLAVLATIVVVGLTAWEGRSALVEVRHLQTHPAPDVPLVVDAGPGVRVRVMETATEATVFAETRAVLAAPVVLPPESPTPAASCPATLPPLGSCAVWLAVHPRPDQPVTIRLQPGAMLGDVNPRLPVEVIWLP